VVYTLKINHSANDNSPVQHQLGLVNTLVNKRLEANIITFLRRLIGGFIDYPEL